MMDKEKVISRYDAQVTQDRERVLVTLLRGLGPWKTSVFLIGGLVPRYMVKRKPPDVPAHAGTTDIDIVVDMAVLADTEAYKTLEGNLKHMKFERAENEKGDKVSWRWKTTTEKGTTIIVEFLSDDPGVKGGKLQELPTKGDVTAINIPNASMVFDLHDKTNVTAELLGGGGKSTEVVAYADIVSFTTLKALAFDQRFERKDAHDIVYCLENVDGGLASIVPAFTKALAGKHAGPVKQALDILRRRFVSNDDAQGFEKDGPVAVAQFEIELDGDEGRDQRLLRQRVASETITELLAEIDAASA